MRALQTAYYASLCFVFISHPLKSFFFHFRAIIFCFSSSRYLDNRVYAALGNGNIMVYSRNGRKKHRQTENRACVPIGTFILLFADGVWDKAGAKVLPVGSPEYPVRKMLAVGGRIWCAVQNKVHVIDAKLLELMVRNIKSKL